MRFRRTNSPCDADRSEASKYGTKIVSLSTAFLVLALLSGCENYTPSASKSADSDLSGGAQSPIASCEKALEDELTHPAKNSFSAVPDKVAFTSVTVSFAGPKTTVVDGWADSSYANGDAKRADFECKFINGVFKSVTYFDE
jgi:hypothetical protein